MSLQRVWPTHLDFRFWYSPRVIDAHCFASAVRVNECTAPEINTQQIYFTDWRFLLHVPVIPPAFTCMPVQELLFPSIYKVPLSRTLLPQASTQLTWFHLDFTSSSANLYRKNPLINCKIIFQNQKQLEKDRNEDYSWKIMSLIPERRAVVPEPTLHGSCWAANRFISPRDPREWFHLVSFILLWTAADHERRPPWKYFIFLQRLNNCK